MRWLIVLLWLLPGLATAQTTEVFPGELGLSVSVANSEVVPYTREMVLITIRGVYRRHITRETLKQPDFEGFNWTQLGPDRWFEERIRGQKVKIFERRMAVYPERAGELTIGAFTHQLTLTDERDNWFDHAITSEPITIRVDPAPPVPEGSWWFPTRSLRVSDDWSNAPDQLQPGEGVLRVIRIEAVGVTPEMIPPMPELTSPSAMIFPHPEKRLVELSPEGPVTYAFWRWTIRPTNTTSAILEPIEVDFYDTRNRVPRKLTISAQRVAYETATVPVAAMAPVPARLPGWPVALTGAAALALGLGAAVRGWRYGGAGALRRFPLTDPAAWRLRRAAWRGDLRAVRREAAAMLRRDGPSRARQGMLDRLDRAIFAPGAPRPDARAFARSFLRAADTNG